MFSVAQEATKHPSPLHYLQISTHITHLQAVQKYGNQMGRDLDCMLGEGKAKIPVFKSHQQSLLLYEVRQSIAVKPLLLQDTAPEIACIFPLPICDHM
jgi:hypothetical protein